MEWARLLIDAVGTVIWPLTVVVIVILFRRQIRERFSAVTKAELPGGVKLELRELEKTVQKSEVIAHASAAPAPLTLREHVSRTADPLLIVAGTRLEIEREVLRLAQLAPGIGGYWETSIASVVRRLREEQVLPQETKAQLLDYIRVTNQVLHAPDASTEDAVVAVGIGASILAYVRHLRRVEYLVRDFEAHGLWHMHGHPGVDEKYLFWSAIAATLPDFDYSYEAYQEAAERFNGIEERRARKLGRPPRLVYVPPLTEFIEVLEHRRTELLRILSAAPSGGDHWSEVREWQWPKHWGHIGWTGPIVRGFHISGAEEELLRTEYTLERYRQRLLIPDAS